MHRKSTSPCCSPTRHTEARAETAHEQVRGSIRALPALVLSQPKDTKVLQHHQPARVCRVPPRMGSLGCASMAFQIARAHEQGVGRAASEKREDQKGLWFGTCKLCTSPLVLIGCSEIWPHSLMASYRFHHMAASGGSCPSARWAGAVGSAARAMTGGRAGGDFGKRMFVYGCCSWSCMYALAHVCAGRSRACGLSWSACE